MRLAPYFIGPLRHRAAATLLCVAVIALGVALGLAVEAINRSALAEFNRGMRSVSGQADLEVRGGRAGFDERLYAEIARMDEVEAASPVLELDARIPGQDEPLRLVGVDLFQAARLAAAVNAYVEEGDRFDVFDPEVVFLSPAAASWLGVARGQTVGFQSGLEVRELRVGGVVAGVPAAQRLALMDIAGAQWKFDRLGVLTRMDLRLRPGADPALFRARLKAMLPPGIEIAEPAQAESRQARLSRAYRVNLNMLAMIGLFTGALLVFSAQALAVVRRRSELAFLRAAGVTRAQILSWLVAEGAVIGFAGGLAGVALGYGAAAVALATFGGDLGAGYFTGERPPLLFDWRVALGFLGLGIAAAAAGAWAPAMEAAAAVPGSALKAGDEHHAFARRPRTWRGVVVVAAGAAFAFMPPAFGLPVFGYVAVILILLGTIMLMPSAAIALTARLPMRRALVWQLALAQLRAAPGQSAVAASAILASVGFATAMAIMVASFRDSVDAWLHDVLPADLYVRASRPGETGFLDTGAQAAIAAAAGVDHVEFVAHATMLLAADKPAVALIARDNPNRGLALVASAAPTQDVVPLAWISEAMVDFHKWTPGAVIDLPLAGQRMRFRVAGVWRDYARQHGAVVISRAEFVRATGDTRAGVAELTLREGADVSAVTEQLRRSVPGGERMEISERGAIRTLSLRIFDRTFAVTYAMEAAAVAIGVFGVAASFASLATLRRREFGMLRHIGMTRGQIARMLAVEGALVSGLGVFGGLAVGGVISLLLVHVINRQSFHWSMDMAFPAAPLAAFATVTIAVATGAAVWAARRAMQTDAVRAVREDW